MAFVTSAAHARPPEGTASNAQACWTDSAFPPIRPTCRCEGKTAPMSRNLRRDRAHADLLRRTAARLRDDPDGARRAGLACTEDAVATAALLDLLAVELPHLDAATAAAWSSSRAAALLD